MDFTITKTQSSLWRIKANPNTLDEQVTKTKLSLSRAKTAGAAGSSIRELKQELTILRKIKRIRK